MNHLTWPRVMSVWWLMFWRASVGSFLLGVLTGTI